MLGGLKAARSVALDIVGGVGECIYSALLRVAGIWVQQG